MQLSAFADLESGVWDVAVDGRWLGDGPGDRPVIDFDAVDVGAYASARLLAVWLADGQTFQLAALRPANAKGQDKDQMTISLPASEGALQVFDPRLSTEYDGHGAPRRFGVELWLGEDEDADQHPFRLAGEATEPAPALPDGTLTVQPMRARRGDLDGLGLYLLIR